MDSTTPIADFLLNEGFLVAVLLGLCLGSLATAMAYRLPRDISMIANERSCCPMCNRALGVLDLIPIISWLALRGRCRGCKAPYGFRYLGIEVATLALCLAFYFFLPDHAPHIAFYLAAPVVIAHIAIDFEWRLLLDKLNLALGLLAIVGIALAADLLPLDSGVADWRLAGDMLVWSVAGALFYGGFSALLRFVVGMILKREPMGLGDVKFFAAAGAWLGPDVMLLSHFMILSGVAGIALGICWRLRYGALAFPFGPALIVTFIGLLLAQQGLLAAAVPVYGNIF